MPRQKKKWKNLMFLMEDLQRWKNPYTLGFPFKLTAMVNSRQYMVKCTLEVRQLQEQLKADRQYKRSPRER